MEETRVRNAAEECLKAWNCDSTSPSIHPSCSVLELQQDGSYKSVARAKYAFPSELIRRQPFLLDVKILHVIGERNTVACVHCHREEHAGWLVMLYTDSCWQCISASFSPRAQESILPRDFTEVMATVWDGYCTANRACDGAAMARVFHPTSRLTFVVEAKVQVMDQKSFCHKIENRYKEAPHLAYAHLQNDPRVASRDSLLAIEFATPDLAMVTLRVGHAPFLWTDLLTVAKLNGTWWIVHKSSCSEDFLVDLKQQE